MHFGTLARSATIAVLTSVAGAASAQTAFTYQGQLQSGGQLVTGTVDLRFSLYGSPSLGSPIGGSVINSAVPVQNGLFTTLVDFGVNPFINTSILWMQIDVRSPAGVGGFTALSVRQPLTPSPYSLSTRGINVSASGLVGIGTATPATPLDVRSVTNPFMTVGTPSNTDGALFFGNPSHGVRRNYNGITNDVGLYTTSGNLQFSTSGSATSQMTLDTTGTLNVGPRAQLASSGNSNTDGFVGLRRSATGLLSAMLSGFGNGYQIALVNTTQTALIGSFFSNYTTNQTTIQATVKNFVEPNPSDPSTDIYYACIEGPEAAMYTRGTGTLVNGHASISLPAHFADLASSQGITVILTPLSGDSLGLAATNKSVSGFEVRELMRGTGTYQFDWEIKAVRKQFLNYQVVRPWDLHRVSNPNVTDAQAWQIRQQDVMESNARAAALESAATSRN